MTRFVWHMNSFGVFYVD